MLHVEQDMRVEFAVIYEAVSQYCRKLLSGVCSQSTVPPFPHAAAFGNLYALNCSRSAVFRIFPVAVCGMASTKTISSGIHHLAILPSMYFRMSSRVALAPCLSCTIRSGRSSHFG